MIISKNRLISQGGLSEIKVGDGISQKIVVGGSERLEIVAGNNISLGYNDALNRVTINADIKPIQEAYPDLLFVNNFNNGPSTEPNVMVNATYTGPGTTIDEVTKKFGKGALSFGSDGNLKITLDSPIDEWSFGAWIYTKNHGNLDQLLAEATDADGFSVRIAHLGAGTYIQNSSYQLWGPRPVADPRDKWTHIAFSRKSKAGGLSIYLDGVLVFKTTDPSALKSIQFGKTISGTWQMKDGLIDDIVLSSIDKYPNDFQIPTEEFNFIKPTEVKQGVIKIGDGISQKISIAENERLELVAGNNISLYYDDMTNKVQISASLDPKIVLSLDPDAKHLSFLYTSTTDVSGNFIDSLDGKSTVVKTGTPSIRLNEGKFGNATLFDGDADYIVFNGIDSAFNFRTSDFTVEIWIKSSTAKNSVILDRYDTGGWQLYITSAGVLSWYKGSALVASTSAQTIFNNQWHHVAVSRESGIVKIFLNGVQLQSVTDTTDYNSTKSLPLAIGAQVAGRNAAYDYNGLLSAVRIYNGFCKYNKTFSVPAEQFPGVEYTAVNKRRSVKLPINTSVIPIAYVVDNLMVFLNGILLEEADYIATNGSTITLIEPTLIDNETLTVFNI